MQTSQKIKRSVWVAKIIDDEGHFVFDNLPAGEYMLRVSFDYYKNRKFFESTGATVTMINNQVIGVQEHLVPRHVSINQGPELPQTVVVAKDGDSVAVELKKTQLLDIN